MAREKRRAERGAARCVSTMDAPALSPQMATRAASPPNAAALRATQRRASRESCRPKLPAEPSVDSAATAAPPSQPSAPSRPAGTRRAGRRRNGLCLTTAKGGELALGNSVSGEQISAARVDTRAATRRRRSLSKRRATLLWARGLPGASGWASGALTGSLRVSKRAQAASRAPRPRAPTRLRKGTAHSCAPDRSPAACSASAPGCSRRRRRSHPARRSTARVEPGAAIAACLRDAPRTGCLSRAKMGRLRRVPCRRERHHPASRPQACRLTGGAALESLCRIGGRLRAAAGSVPASTSKT
eukprot:scaffold118650_cov62-Phaeocystis_antarctica.AAC.6